MLRSHAPHLPEDGEYRGKGGGGQTILYEILYNEYWDFLNVKNDVKVKD